MKKHLNYFILLVLSLLFVCAFIPGITSIITKQDTSQEGSLLRTSANSGDLLWNYTTLDGIRSVDINANADFITASTYDPDSSLYLF